MEHWYHIFLKDKIEYADGPRRAKSFPIGSLLFSFLDVDWDELSTKLSDFRGQYPDDQAILEYYDVLREGFAEAHPFISHTVERLILETNPDTLKALYIRVSELARFKEALSGQITLTLDSQGDYSQLTPVQRHVLVHRTTPSACSFAQSMYDLISVQHRISANGERIFPLSKEEVTKEHIAQVVAENFSAFLYYGADDIRALVYLEYEYMCTQGYAIRRCDNCGRWFLPYSVAALYCDRPVENRGKTCKEIAATEKYLQKVNSDAAKKLYTRLNNNYQMRCARTPEAYSQKERAEWQRRAKVLLEEITAGKLTYDAFAAAIRLPETN